MKAVIYARYSSDKQKDSFSIEEQIEACTKKAKQEGYEIVKTFIDKAQSASTLDRPELALLLTYVPKNTIDAVYILDISRLSRNSIDFQIIKKEFSKCGCTIRSVNGIPNDTLEGDMVQDILARVSQYKNEIDAMKIRGGMYQRFKAGLALRPVRGYRWSDNIEGRKTLIPSDEFKLIQSVWLKVLNEKLTIKQALKYANSILPHKISKTSLNNMLHNKIYYGILCYPTYAEEVIGLHKPMIDEQTFIEVQGILEGRTFTKTRVRLRVNPDYPLTKILYCPSCKGKVRAASSKGKNKSYEYYFCPNRSSCKYNKSVTKAHDTFVQFLEKLEPTEELMQFVRRILKEKWESKFNAINMTYVQVEKEVEKLKIKRKVIKNMLFEGAITKEDYKESIAEVDSLIISKQTLLSEKKLEQLDIEIVINFVEFYMRNAHKIWQKFSIETKIALQSSTFPKGLEFTGRSYRTPLISPAWRLSQKVKQVYSTKNSSVVIRQGLEP